MVNTLFFVPSVRPPTPWYFMNGNLIGKVMTADLESINSVVPGKRVFEGIGRQAINFPGEENARSRYAGDWDRPTFPKCSILKHAKIEPDLPPVAREA